MPTDSKGNFQLSGLRPGKDGKLPSVKSPEKTKEVDGNKAEKPEGEKVSSLHDHGDGTFHTEHGDGEKVEHPTLSHAVTHLAQHHAEGKHMHMHESGGVVHSHGLHEHGEHDEPQDSDAQGAADHAAQFFGNAGEGDSQDAGMDQGEEPSLSGFGG